LRLKVAAKARRLAREVTTARTAAGKPRQLRVVFMRYLLENITKT